VTANGACAVRHIMAATFSTLQLGGFVRGVVGGFAVLLEIDGAEEVDGFGEAFLQAHFGFPIQILFGEGDVRAALAGVVLLSRHVGDFGFAGGHFDDELDEFEHREFAGVADVNGADEGVGAVHQARL